MKVNWCDFREVVEYCQYLNSLAQPGFESVVIKHPNRQNYNIRHRKDAIEDKNVVIVFDSQTGGDV